MAKKETRKVKRWPVHVTIGTYSDLKRYAAEREESVSATAEALIVAGLKRKQQDKKRHAPKSTEAEKTESAAAPKTPDPETE
jgi:hypothetical protein